MRRPCAGREAHCGRHIYVERQRQIIEEVSATAMLAGQRLYVSCSNKRLRRIAKNVTGFAASLPRVVTTAQFIQSRCECLLLALAALAVALQMFAFDPKQHR